jgi:hypothetical protein
VLNDLDSLVNTDSISIDAAGRFTRISKWFINRPETMSRPSITSGRIDLIVSVPVVDLFGAYQYAGQISYWPE